jgi:hypothetical protein
MFPDEAGFIRDGIIDFLNSHVWTDQNPHATFQSRHQHLSSINKWVGILGDKLIGPYFFATKVHRHSYLKYSARVSGRCTFGKKSGLCMMVLRLISPLQSGSIFTIPILNDG